MIAIAFNRHSDLHGEDAAIAEGKGIAKPSIHRRVVTKDGATIDHELCRRNEGRWFAGLGGLFVGMISTGLGELNSYALVIRCRIPTRVTVATSVVVVAVTALAASITHFVGFVAEGGDALEEVFAIVVFTVPGVIIGGQLGPKVSARFQGVSLVHFLGWLFLFVAALTLGEAFLAG